MGGTGVQQRGTKIAVQQGQNIEFGADGKIVRLLG